MNDKIKYVWELDRSKICLRCRHKLGRRLVCEKCGFNSGFYTSREKLKKDEFCPNHPNIKTKYYCSCCDRYYCEDCISRKGKSFTKNSLMYDLCVECEKAFSKQTTFIDGDVCPYHPIGVNVPAKMICSGVTHSRSKCNTKICDECAKETKIGNDCYCFVCFDNLPWYRRLFRF